MKMNCNDIEERIAAYLVDDLTVQERYWIEMHLRDCAECRAEIESLAGIAESLQADFDSEPEFTLDPHRRAALSEQFAQANPDMDIATRRRWRRIRAMAANMSVAAALLLGAYLGFITGNQRVQQPEAPEFTLEISSTELAMQSVVSEPVTLASQSQQRSFYLDYVDLSALWNYSSSESRTRPASGVSLAAYPGLPIPQYNDRGTDAYTLSE